MQKIEISAKTIIFTVLFILLLQFLVVIKDLIFASFRLELDLKFLELYAEIYGIRLEWWPHKIDVFSYARGFLDARGEKLPSPDLYRIAKLLKLPMPNPPYRAIDQAKITYELYKRIRGIKKPPA